MKIKDPKIFFLLVPFVVIVGLIANAGKKPPIEFEVDGKVMIASWEGKNHGMPLFIIKQNDDAGTKRKLESDDVTLTPMQIKEGDTFIKFAGSKNCRINGVEIQCIK